MSKYHVSEDGMVRVCKAQSIERCTAVSLDGNPSEHYSTKEEANHHSELMMEEHYGTFATAKPVKFLDRKVSMKEFSDAIDKFEKDFKKEVSSAHPLGVYDEKMALAAKKEIVSRALSMNKFDEESIKETVDAAWSSLKHYKDEGVDADFSYKSVDKIVRSTLSTIPMYEETINENDPVSYEDVLINDTKREKLINKYINGDSKLSDITPIIIPIAIDTNKRWERKRKLLNL